ncbi:MAG: hypothetical protein JWR50_1829 [Mucilaginibacter sp.]|nr:hypothetical protein [Mucilaginibacter sp.]
MESRESGVKLDKDQILYCTTSSNINKSGVCFTPNKLTHIPKSIESDLMGILSAGVTNLHYTEFSKKMDLIKDGSLNATLTFQYEFNMPLYISLRCYLNYLKYNVCIQ